MPNTTKAAGILFRTPDKQVLYLKRGNGGDFPGYWCFPGGHMEEGETAEEAAKREAKEELGKYPKTDLKELCRATGIYPMPAATPASPLEDNPLPHLDLNSQPALPPPDAPGQVPTTDYTTFLAKVDETFDPQLNGEHVGWAWAPVDQPPQPIHPGCLIALEREGMDELAIARALSQGRLAGPIRYENVMLVAMRITGTGMAYRRGLDEYVWRDPDHYLNDEFLARCNGLIVVWEHPEKAVLDSGEFEKRVIGSIMLPYLAGQEVWGVAKIYDAEAADQLEAGQLSTSPGVLFRDPSVNNKMTVDDSNLLIEGKPSLLDHLAVCALGVWDKRGDPRGVMNVNMERAVIMADEDKDAAEKRREEEMAKQDADAGEKLDKCLSMLDSVNARLDAYEADEKARKDAEEAEEKEAEEKAKKDADDEAEKKKKEEEEKAAMKKDADDKEDEARKDAQATMAELRAELAAMKATQQQIINGRPAEDEAAFAAMQVRADSVYQGFNQRAPAPLVGEALHAYKVRLIGGLKQHSARWAKIDSLTRMDAQTLDNVMADVYADAQAAANAAVDVPVGELRERVSINQATGQRIVTFQGPHTFIKAMNRTGRRVTNISNPSQRGA